MLSYKLSYYPLLIILSHIPPQFIFVSVDVQVMYIDSIYILKYFCGFRGRFAWVATPPPFVGNIYHKRSFLTILRAAPAPFLFSVVDKISCDRLQSRFKTFLDPPLKYKTWITQRIYTYLLPIPRRLLLSMVYQWLIWITAGSSPHHWAQLGVLRSAHTRPPPRCILPCWWQIADNSSCFLSRTSDNLLQQNVVQYY